MKLATFTDHVSNAFRVGIVVTTGATDYVVDVREARNELPGDMRSLLRMLDGDFSILASLARSAPQSAHVPLADVAFGPVIGNPEKILGIGLNYRDHAAELGLPLPDYPTVFAKFANTLIGSGEPILLPGNTTQIDYEAELAFVISRRASNVAVEDAFSYVAGYAALNDVSARDFQMRTTQWTMGKCFDSFAPFGPYLVTCDEIRDPHALSIKLFIGDEILQDSSTSNLVFRIPELVSQLSAAMTLEPGDIVTTGTPGGVGYKRQPPRFLKAGDMVRIEITGLGILENPVRAIDESQPYERRDYVCAS